MLDDLARQGNILQSIDMRLVPIIALSVLSRYIRDLCAAELLDISQAFSFLIVLDSTSGFSADD